MMKLLKYHQFRSSRRLNLLTALLPLLILADNHFLHVQGIFNCFSRNMFKAGKGGHYQQPVVGGPERAHWYPQQYQYQLQQPQTSYPAPYPMAYAYQPSMKSLFRPKWKSSSLFGYKGWNNWQSGHNYYRPSYGSSYQPPVVSQQPQYNEDLNAGPILNQQVAYPISSDGWSVSTVPGYSTPVSSKYQTNIPSYDGFGPSSTGYRPSSLSPYSTKNLGGKYAGTKSVLLADGGYNSFDAHSSSYPRNNTYGYSYPEWYSGSVESPARIAQQLLKYGLRNQHQNRSAPLRADSNANAQFTMLDEPRFVGFGTVDTFNNKEARLSCSFSEAIDQSNPPLWVKFTGPYNSTQTINGKVVPPFNCANSLCRTQEIETTKDYRYKFDNGPATSTLIIYEPRLADHAIYRCSALTKTFNDNPIETIYQIVRFF